MKNLFSNHSHLLERGRFPQDRFTNRAQSRPAYRPVYQMDAAPPPPASTARQPVLREEADFLPLNIIIAGGITGGHLFPGIAIAQAFKLRQPDTDILFISIGNALEREALEKNDFQGRWIRIEGIKGRGFWQKTKALMKLPAAILSSMAIMRAFKPDLVIGMGGYSSGPVILAARLMGIKIALHEQNMLPGITNRKLARLARRVYVSFPDTEITAAKDRIVLSGNPIRKEIIHSHDWMDIESEEDTRPQGPEGSLTSERFTVLVLGGSQGAHSINMAMIEALGHIERPEQYFFIHQTGAADESLVKGAYLRHNLAARVKPFFQDVARQYASADIVICRAGATTIAEITAMGKPALFIPFPYAADDHQVRNARALAAASAADMMLETGLTGSAIAKRLAAYTADKTRLAEMARCSKALGRPDAAEKIVDDCYRMLSEEKA